MYPANIPVNPYKLNLNKKGDKYTTCTVLRKICLPIAKASTPLTRVKPICSILAPMVFLRCFEFTHAPFSHPLPPLLFSLFSSSLQTCQTFSFSFESYPPNHSIPFALFFLVVSFLLFTSFVWSFNPGIYNTATFLFRLIGASFFHRSRRIFPDRFLSK